MEDLVTICIPTFNGEVWIEEAMRSALRQTYKAIEVLVVDDASTDDTVHIARSIEDDRIRVKVNPQTLGLVRNWNKCLQLSKGKFIKPLFQDDILYPECVQYMHPLLKNYENVGFVFAPRDMLVRNSDGSWVTRSARIADNFDQLEEINKGDLMLRQWLRYGYRENWIGEPSSVMLRKSCLDKVGLFNIRMWMCADFELWMRMMYQYDVGFVNHPLSAFRVHRDSATIVGTNLNLHWLDMTWLVEGLLASGLGREYPELNRLRLTELFFGLKYQIWRIRRRYKMHPSSVTRAALGYAAYRLSLVSGAQPQIHERLLPQKSEQQILC